MRGVSTDDANFLLLRLQELSFRWQDFPLYFIFLDWVKCYDKIHHGPLLDALRRFGLPQQYLDVIMVIYKDLKFFVRDAWGESDLRPQAEGLRQGDPLACFLLLILMTVIMLDTRKAFEAICTEKNFSAAAHYMERVAAAGPLCRFKKRRIKTWKEFLVSTTSSSQTIHILYIHTS